MTKYNWEEEISHIRDLYENQKRSINEIAKMYGCTPKTLSLNMRRLGIETHSSGDDRRCNAMYHIDSHYFDCIDTEDKAYILGLITSDGHISKNNLLMFSFQNRDAAILDAVRMHMKSNHPLKTRHNNTSKTLYMASSVLCRRLREMGLNNNKSYWFDFEKLLTYVPDHLLHHFVRGLFDGDGSVRIYQFAYQKKHTYHFGLTGIKPVCDFFNKFFDLHTKMTDEGNGIWTAQSANHAKIIAAYHKLYQDATIYMDRKRDTFLRVIDLCRDEHPETVQDLQRL